MNKLNWGCGDKVYEGWSNVDIDQFGGNIVSDIRKENLPFNDNHFDVIVAQHSLSMLNYHDLPRALRELHRVLKPGGIIRIADFDALNAIDAYKKKDHARLIIPDSVEPTLDGKFAAYLTWYGTRLSMHTAQGWVEMLENAGFKAHRSNFMKTGYDKPEATEALALDLRPKESVYAEGTK